MVNKRLVFTGWSIKPCQECSLTKPWELPAYALAKDMFVHRMQGIKETLHGFEDFVQAQLEDFPRRRDSRDSRSDSQRQEEPRNDTFGDPKTQRHGWRISLGDHHKDNVISCNV